MVKRPLRRLEKSLHRALVALAVAVVPRLYIAYMWLVYRTSRVEYLGCTPDVLMSRYGRAVIALWHEEVFFVAYAFRHLRAHTLASRGDFGALITRMLELCNFVVFRGGSSGGKSRSAPHVLRDMIRHMNTAERVLYGVTVDGSNGPPHRFKHGAATIAVACRAPLGIEKTWCRRYLRLPTWDRTLVPLPFNHIVHVFAGPYLPPRNAEDPEAFERFRKAAEDALLDLGEHARRLVEEAVAIPTNLVFPLEPIEIDPPEPAKQRR